MYITIVIKDVVETMRRDAEILVRIDDKCKQVVVGKGLRSTDDACVLAEAKAVELRDKVWAFIEKELAQYPAAKV